MCPPGQACHGGDDGSYDTVTTPVTRFMTGTRRQSTVPCKSQQDTGPGTLSHYLHSYIAPRTAQWSPEGEEELPVTTAVCSALWDTRRMGKPGLGFKMTQLDWNLMGNLKRKRRSFEQMSSSHRYICANI